MTDTDDNLISVAPIPSTPTHIQTLHEWQLCPKCGGQGLVSKPPWIAGDVLTWHPSSTAAHQCDLCNGKKIISKLNGLPPV